VAGTLAPMTHVWVVGPPGGALAEHVDSAWVRDYNRARGESFSWPG
jgi:hypothetical protein